MIWHARVLTLLSLLALAGCGAQSAAPSRAAPPPLAATGSSYAPPRDLIGVDARRLFSLFGTPRLDIQERTVRKLQFGNGRCVLDAYLYAPARGKEPVVTHVDTRQTDGQSTEPTGCARALQRP